jgi:hypothetical protein
LTAHSFTDTPMIANDSQMFAGHAGDAGLPSAMPHEVLGGIALLAAIGVILIVIGAMAVWLLVKIERRLRNPNKSG